MATIIEINNPFEPFKETQVHHDVKEQTILAWLSRYGEPWTGFERATICIVNGEAIMQADYDKFVVREKDTVNFVVLMGDPISIIIAVVVAIVAVAAVLAFAPQPPAVGDTPEPDPTFSLKGQANANKLGQSIPSHYGRKKNWPDYAARPYGQYIGNQQYNYSLFCLGQGYYNVSDFQIEDTPIENFQDVTIEIYNPGEQVTLFPDAVITSVEVAGIELYAPNEPEFIAASGPYVANDALTVANRLEVDVSLPKGLYFSNDSGSLSAMSIAATFEYQQIDDAGVAIGPWIVFENFTATLATVTPQRFTLSLDVAIGRYQMRAIRTNNKNSSHRVGHVVAWDSMRAFLEVDQNYGDVTLVAMRALATNNLNDNSRTRFNCIQQRKLPTYNLTTNSWEAPTVTRNPIWAFADVMRSKYGGNLDTQFIEIERLTNLATQFNALGYDFDWTFDNKLNLWSAAKVCLSVARSIPMLNGSRITAIHDELKTIPLQTFQQENMFANTFSLGIKAYKINDHDGFELEYLDEDTWEPETMLITVGNDAGLNPKNVKLNGVINRDKAYRWGLYERAKEVYQRQTVTFKVGLEGNIPTVNTLVSVVHDVPKWGKSGFVLQMQGNQFTMSEDIEFEAGKSYQIMFRKRDGSASALYNIQTNGAGVTNVIETTVVPTEDLFRLGVEQPVIYQLGEAGSVSRLFKIRKVEPAGEGVITISAVNDDHRIFPNANTTAPPKTNISIPPIIPNLPSVTGLNVGSVPNEVNKVQVSWNATVGATSYIVEISYDNITFTQQGTTTGTSYVLDVTAGTAWIRVAAINVALGAYALWTGQVGVATNPPNNATGLSLVSPFTGLTAALQWTAVSTASSYDVEVMVQGGAVLRTENVLASNYSYSISDAVADFGSSPINRNLAFKVTSKNSQGSGDMPQTLLATNPPPSAPASVNATKTAEDATTFTIAVSWAQVFESDIKHYIVYASDTPGFTADGTTQVIQGVFLNTSITVAKGSPVQTAYYFRVAAVDQWGVETGLSNEEVIDLTA